MYVQITTRCNMTCEHCAFDCTTKGEDMTRETFLKAIQDQDYITIGGGEPTLHPKFKDFLLEALATCEGITVITNGSNTKTALLLHKMNRIEGFDAKLSQDCFHDPIDEKVIDTYTRSKSIWSDWDTSVIKARGRAYENNIGSVNGCVCPGPITKPNGDIHQCGCAGSPKVGTVLGDYWDIDIDDHDIFDECGWDESKENSFDGEYYYKEEEE